MAWLKVEVQTPDKPEIFDIADQLGIDPDAAFGKCFRVWCWFDAHTTDGKTNGVGVSDSLLDRLTNVSGFARAMHEAGWLDSDGDVYTMPNFDTHNGESAKKRGLTAKRVAKCTNAKLTHEALPRLDKRREEVNLNSLSGKPDGVGQEEDQKPAPPNPEEAKLVIDFLNEKTGKHYRHTAPNLNPILALMWQGYTVQDIKTVTMRKVRDWIDDEKKSSHLTPATLYEPKKFNSYAGVLND